jgi:hypothetical protein
MRLDMLRAEVMDGQLDKSQDEILAGPTAVLLETGWAVSKVVIEVVE